MSLFSALFVNTLITNEFLYLIFQERMVKLFPFYSLQYIFSLIFVGIQVILELYQNTKEQPYHGIF